MPSCCPFDRLWSTLDPRCRIRGRRRSSGSPPLFPFHKPGALSATTRPESRCRFGSAAARSGSRRSMATGATNQQSRRDQAAAGGVPTRQRPTRPTRRVRLLVPVLRSRKRSSRQTARSAAKGPPLISYADLRCCGRIQSPRPPPTSSLSGRRSGPALVPVATRSPGGWAFADETRGQHGPDRRAGPGQS